MKSTLAWVNDELVWTTTKKRRVLARFIGRSFNSYVSLQTFWDGTTYFIGMDESIHLRKEVEAYWSRVDGETYLIHFDPKMGDTIAVPNSSTNLLRCRKP